MENKVGGATPAPPASPVARRESSPEPGESLASLRMKVWDRQKKRQLGFKWDRDFGTTVLENAAEAANEGFSAAGAPFSVTVSREGAGPVLVLARKGVSKPVAVSQPVPQGRLSSESAARIVARFCRMHGAGPPRR